MIMNKALKSFGSTADFIALIGYNDNNRKPYVNDINLLKQQGIIVYNLHRLVHSSNKLSFAEMALLKVTPWNIMQRFSEQASLHPVYIWIIPLPSGNILMCIYRLIL